MRFIVLTDEMPATCKDCHFYGEDLVPVNEKRYDVQEKCLLGECTYENCPLTVIKAVFEENKEEK